MEPHRVSTSSSAPAAPVHRSKAPAPNRPVDGAADDPATAGSFLSLLSALGDGAAEEALEPAAALLFNATPLPDVALFSHAAQLPDVAPLSQASQLPGLTPLSPSTQRLDTPLLAGAAQGPNASLLAWQGADARQPLTSAAVEGGAGATLSLADTAQRTGLLAAELLGQGGLVAQTARIDAAVELPAAQRQGGAVAGYQRAFARLQNVLSQGAPAGSGLTAQALGHQSAGTGRLAAPVSLASPTALGAAPEESQAATAAAPRALSDVAALPPLPQWLATEPATRSVAVPVATEYGSGAGALSGPTHGTPGEPRLDGAPAVPEPPAAGAEDAVTEQATYWVSDNLQNADLTVTHDGMPVQVTVSLSGKETHVAFRSDESQTRDLLSASQNQLRDMLGNGGLVLSGVSVGESGARQASGEGAASSRGRASRRVTVQVPVSEGAADARSRPGVLTDRAVDVFV